MELQGSDTKNKVC